jgi:xanthine dehydrogenase YagS FAD-binding subunit
MTAPVPVPAASGASAVPELRAGGTDLTERRRSGVSSGPVVDIERHPDLYRVDWRADGGVTIGALTTIARLAEDPRLGAAYPGLAAAAGGLATPQIRRVGTLGGNLLQRTRCWYYRHPSTSCLKKGGTECPARTGNHLYGVLFDLGPCVAPHPSTLGAALLAYDAVVSTDAREAVAVADVFGDGSDGTRDHRLAPGELLTAVRLPAPAAGERAAYFRAISRTYAEWPLAEAVCRLVMARGPDGGDAGDAGDAEGDGPGGVVTFAAVAVGGVAPVPLRLPAVEQALLGQPLTPATVAAASALAADGADPLPMTGYKAALLVGTVAETLERAAAS